jgi:hypothetical protein
MNASTQITHKYPDTSEGAKQALADMSVFSYNQMSGAYPDPMVAGVWKVYIENNSCTFAIVYLAGYPNPFGTIRLTNDFECDD